MTTVIFPKTRETKAYRLRCRFKTDPYPSRGELDRQKVIIAEKFISDMHKQGWGHDARYEFKMTGPFPMVEPMAIHVPRMLTAREMAPLVAMGARCRDTGRDVAKQMPSLMRSESWEYEIAGVFTREQILTERPDAHEEELR